MSTVIMLSGPIGAGKTTVAGPLIAKWEGPLVYIEGDAFWAFLKIRKTGDHRQDFRILMRSMTAAAVPFVRSDYDVLLDFSFPLNFLKTARAILKDVPLDLVVLRPSLAVCAARAAARREGPIKHYDEGFYALFEGAGRHEVSDDVADGPQIADRIRAGLATGAFRVV